MRESNIPDRDETIKYLEDLNERLKETPFIALGDNYIEQLKASLNYSPTLKIRDLKLIVLDWQMSKESKEDHYVNIYWTPRLEGYMPPLLIGRLYYNPLRIVNLIEDTETVPIVSIVDLGSIQIDYTEGLLGTLRFEHIIDGVIALYSEEPEIVDVSSSENHRILLSTLANVHLSAILL